MLPSPCKKTCYDRPRWTSGPEGLIENPAEVLSGKSHTLMKRCGNTPRLTLSLPGKLLRGGWERQARPYLIFSDLLAPPTTQLAPKSKVPWTVIHQRKRYFFSQVTSKVKIRSNFLQSSFVYLGEFLSHSLLRKTSLLKMKIKISYIKIKPDPKSTQLSERSIL